MGKIVELLGEKVYLKSWREKLADIHEQNTKNGMRAREDFIRISNRTPEEADREHAELKAKNNARFKGAKERLAYYRSHGLDNCSDYPGGDEAFERDVLSGEQRDEKLPFSFDMKQEDDYIYKCLENGHFVPEPDFYRTFVLHPKIEYICRHVFSKLYGVMFTWHPNPWTDPWSPYSRCYCTDVDKLGD